MPAATIRANYDQLNQVSSAFRKNVDASVRTLQMIKSNKDVLQGGDWVGQGATAFYREMDDSVLPTLQRLINALETAASSTSQISAIMKQAEDEAAKVLNGSGLGPGSAAGASLGAAGGTALGAGLGSSVGGLGGLAGSVASVLGGVGAAAAGVAGTAAGAMGATAGGGTGSASDQITQLTNEATQAVSSLSDVPDAALNNAVNQLGNAASQFDGIVPPNFQSDGNGLGPLLSAIGSPNAGQVAQQVTQPFSGGGGGSSGGGSSGGGSSGGGGGPSGGGGGGSPSGGSASAMQGFSDQALQSLMNNTSLPPQDRMLAMAVETLRRDPNAFNGALKQFVDQALGQGATGPAAQAVGGGISALAGAAGISAGGSPPTSTTDAISNLANQYNNIVQGGGGAASSQAVVSPINASAPPAPPPASAGNAIANLVQQFIQTVNAVIPKN
jgi:WXG100 family type VII secretion target